MPFTHVFHQTSRVCPDCGLIVAILDEQDRIISWVGCECYWYESEYPF